jgi:hypothetical protein
VERHRLDRIWEIESRRHGQPPKSVRGGTSAAATTPAVSLASAAAPTPTHYTDALHALHRRYRRCQGQQGHRRSKRRRCDPWPLSTTRRQRACDASQKCGVGSTLPETDQRAWVSVNGGDDASSQAIRRLAVPTNTPRHRRRTDDTMRVRV